MGHDDGGGGICQIDKTLVVEGAACELPLKYEKVTEVWHLQVAVQLWGEEGLVEGNEAGEAG